MTRYFRKAWQIVSAGISYSLFGLGAIFIGLMFRIVDWLPGIASQHKQRWVRCAIHWGCLTFVRLLKLFGLIDYRFQLQPLQATKPGKLIIANHPSLIDVVLLFAAYKDICCIVKAALWNSFFTGATVRLAGFIPNNTEHALALAVDKLHRGEHLLVFPEGTRRDNTEPAHFKRGVANIAVHAEVDILPILIKCYPSALKKDDKWHNIPEGGPKFTLISGELIELNKCVDSTIPRTLQYRRLTRFLEAYYDHWLHGVR